jgi:hypothetical protein
MKYIFLIASIIGVAFNVLDVFKLWGGRSTQEIANTNIQTIITPDGVTFAIWGPIFACLVAIGVSIAIGRTKINRTTLYYHIGSMVAICLWVFTWTSQIAYWPAIFLILILVCNVMVCFGLEGYSKHGYLLYTSWTVIATVLNSVILFQYYIGIKEFVGINSNLIAVVLLVIGAVVYSLMTFRYNSAIPTLVGIWAYFGIIRSQARYSDSNNIKYGSAILVVLMTAVLIAYVAKYRNELRLQASTNQKK